MQDNASTPFGILPMTLPLPFLIKKAISLILLPPMLPLLAIAAGLVLWRRRPRLGRMLAWSGLLLAWLGSTPATLYPLIERLENVPLLEESALHGAQAIVILGAGYRRFMPEYDGPTPNRLALERLRYGARLARQSGLPVAVSGEASLLVESLVRDFGIEPRWAEGESLDTAGNARFTAALLQPEGIRRIVLVTHALHMRRASREFIAQGFEVVPAPTAFMVERAGEEDFFDFLPGPTAAYAGWYAAHEAAGLAVQALRLGFQDPRS